MVPTRPAPVPVILLTLPRAARNATLLAVMVLAIPGVAAWAGAEAAHPAATIPRANAPRSNQTGRDIENPMIECVPALYGSGDRREGRAGLVHRRVPHAGRDQLGAARSDERR